MFADHLMTMGFQCIALAMVMAIIVPKLTPLLVVGLVVFQFQIEAIDRSNRQAKRQAMNSMSPIMTTLAETVNGAPIIHAMGACRCCNTSHSKRSAALSS